MYFLRKYQKTGNGFKERLIIKGFKDKDNLYKFQSEQDNNDWQEITVFPLRNKTDAEVPVKKAGTYAYAGGQWHNVKTLDPYILGHI